MRANHSLSPALRRAPRLATALFFLIAATCLDAQTTPPSVKAASMLDQGTFTLHSPALNLTLVRSSGTVAALSPASDPTIDYTPGDRLQERSADTFYHLGDLDLRLRAGTAAVWQELDTAYRRQPVTQLASSRSRVSEDLAPTLPAGIPLKVVRTWSVEHGVLALRFTLTNRIAEEVHIGGLGIPMVFNNIMHDRTLEQSYARCSFYDPYIGENAGYVQVVRLSGLGPVLLVLPDGHTPLEAWKPILDKLGFKGGPAMLGNDPTPRDTTFEGSFDWMVHSAAFADTDWKTATGQQPQEWNPPTETVLAPGQSITYGLRFVVAPSVRGIEDTLARNARPVAIGIPGYILPQDIDARLFLRYRSPVRSIVSEPAGALAIHDDGPVRNQHAYTVRARDWGRSRLVIKYEDGTLQSIAYRAIKPESEAVADMGRFLFHDQWYTNTGDPFHRAPSVISYDDAAHRQVVEEPRVWIAGLSDEAGAGSWLAASMKEFVAPDPREVAQLESFVSTTLWGHLQESTGAHKYGVHKSLYYYQPDKLPADTYDPTIDWHSWTSWNREAAADLGRSFNYPHVVAAYWSLYRIARNTQGIATAQPWQWYLDQAYQTALAMEVEAPDYAEFGQMEGTIFVRLLEDLQREGWTEKAAKIEAEMRARANAWRAKPYPFGSEMPWDSTGQEEVYGWCRYFGFSDKAEVTLNAILAYTPVVPSWGYNGSARRYWDFLYGGKYPRIERQLHHYGSGINAIPLLTEYRSRPDDLYLLRAGYGGLMGPLASIDQKGFASAAFHSFPDRMAYDPYSGDYGPNFFGFAINTATYLVDDPGLGWLSFGGNVAEKGSSLQLTPLDAMRQRVFIAPAGTWLTLDAGRFQSLTFDKSNKTIRVTLDPATASVSTARLHIEQTASTATGKHYVPAASLKQEGDMYILPLNSQPVILILNLR